MTYPILSLHNSRLECRVMMTANIVPCEDETESRYTQLKTRETSAKGAALCRLHHKTCHQVVSCSRTRNHLESYRLIIMLERTCLLFKQLSIAKCRLNCRSETRKVCEYTTVDCSSFYYKLFCCISHTHPKAAGFKNEFNK